MNTLKNVLALAVVAAFLTLLAASLVITLGKLGFISFVAGACLLIWAIVRLVDWSLKL